jgi:hypothetical protein
MAEVALHLDALSAPELIAAGARLLAGLEGNPHFPKPEPPLDELWQKLMALEEANLRYRKERLRLNDLKTARDAAMRAVRVAMESEADYVQEASDGDTKKIVSANLTVERTWSLWPFAALGQVIELSASSGEQPGEVDLAWDPVSGADGYEVECTDDTEAQGPWRQCAVASESHVTVKELLAHHRYWFRVRAVGEKGEGDWSDLVTKYTR